MRTAEERLRDAREAVAGVVDLIGYGRFAYQNNTTVRLAIERQLTILGEAAKELTRAPQPYILDVRLRETLSKAARLRDVITHQYWRLDREILWTTCVNHMPQLLSEISETLNVSVSIQATDKSGETDADRRQRALLLHYAPMVRFTASRVLNGFSGATHPQQLAVLNAALVSTNQVLAVSGASSTAERHELFPDVKAVPRFARLLERELWQRTTPRLELTPLQTLRYVGRPLLRAFLERTESAPWPTLADLAPEPSLPWHADWLQWVSRLRFDSSLVGEAITGISPLSRQFEGDSFAVGSLTVQTTMGHWSRPYWTRTISSLAEPMRTYAALAQLERLSNSEVIQCMRAPVDDTGLLEAVSVTALYEAVSSGPQSRSQN